MKDFLNPQPTKTEQLIATMYAELTNISRNTTRQLRTLAILAKVKPEKFVEMFNDDISQGKFFRDLMDAEKKFSEEQKEKAEKLKELGVNKQESGVITDATTKPSK